MILTSHQQWQNIKYRENVTLKCDACEKEYYLTKYQYCSNNRRNGIVNFTKKTYCSKKCRSFTKNGYVYSCTQCKQSFIDSSSCKRKFCSHACAARYNNQNRELLSRKNVQCALCSTIYTVAKHVQRKTHICLDCKTSRTLDNHCSPKANHTTHNCKQCGIAFQKKRTQQYCSKACKKKSTRKYHLICQHCQSPYHAERVDSKFCSHKCRSINLQLHLFAHKKSGLSRSKIELFIESKIKQDYRDVVFVFNNKSEIGMELDIYSPQLKLAIELNGVFHYLPVYGDSVLQKIQKRDKQKFDLCAARYIDFHIIDLGNEGYTKHYANRIYSLVCSIIEHRILEVGRPGIDPGHA